MKPLKVKKILVIFKEEVEPHPSKGRLTEHFKTLRKVEEVLKKQKISHHVISRGSIKSTAGYDLLITVGGDGTFLDASHSATPNHLLFGVNSNPERSHGAFCAADRKNFEKVLEALLQGKAPILPLTRLAVKINGRAIPLLALNDALFANRSPAGTSRYLLKAGGKSEEQKSSGVWISTAAGSTAALRSAGGTPMPKKSKDLQFVVREPFVKNGKRYQLIRGRVGTSQAIRIVCHMSKAAVFLDGAHLHYEVEYGDEVEIHAATVPLRAVMKS